MEGGRLWPLREAFTAFGFSFPASRFRGRWQCSASGWKQRCHEIESPLPCPGLSLLLTSPDHHFYDESKPFTCLDGSVTIPFDQVNDDYCDCKDGSDEPGEFFSIHPCTRCTCTEHLGNTRSCVVTKRVLLPVDLIGKAGTGASGPWFGGESGILKGAARERPVPGGGREGGACGQTGEGEGGSSWWACSEGLGGESQEGS